MAKPRASFSFRISHQLGHEGCDEVVQRYEGGETAQVLADEFGVAKSALLNLLCGRNVVLRRCALTEQQVDELSRACELGKTIAKLEAETGILTARSSERSRTLAFK